MIRRLGRFFRKNGLVVIAFNGVDVPLFYTPHGYSFLMKDAGVIKRGIYWGIEKVFANRNCTIISCSKGEYQESLKLTPNATYVDNAIERILII